MKTSRNSGFVADGESRARRAAESHLRDEIGQEYASRMANAAFIEHWRLRLEMRRLLVARRGQAAPPHAHY